MASHKTFPRPYDQIICEDFALPTDTTALICTNIAKIDAAQSGTIWVRVFAHNACEIAANEAVIFYPVIGTDETNIATLTGTGTHAFPGCALNLITNQEITDYTWAAGELICEFAIPSNLIKEANASNTAGTAKTLHNYLAIYIAIHGADHNADHVDIYTYVEG
jgi:hypothetical protein